MDLRIITIQTEVPKEDIVTFCSDDALEVLETRQIFKKTQCYSFESKSRQEIRSRDTVLAEHIIVANFEHLPKSKHPIIDPDELIDMACEVSPNMPKEKIINRLFPMGV